MVRLIGGRRKGKSKGRTGVNMTPEERKYGVRWVTLTEIKNTTGLSLKDLRFILSECGLWSKKYPSSYAVEYHIARWHWMEKRYEWNKARTLKIISDYIQTGTLKEKDKDPGV